ncbi:hypothetical protein MY10362_003364 [Beauveria mimosiformis]
MVNQRSKSGCWTCRLRRKKCSEDGMPCSNCRSRGVVCHGYGPRPAWKDRGQREQQEVERLQLRRRSQTRWHSQPSQHSEQASEQPSSNLQENAASFCLSPALVFASPADMALQPSPPQSTEEQEGELYELAILDQQQPSLPTPNTPFELSDFWVDGMEGLLSSTTPALFEPAVTTLNGQVERPQRDGAGDKCATQAVMQTLASASIQIHTLQEREIELMMQFLGQDFSRLHPCYQSWSITDRAWLMWLLQRSPTFFYAALSTSAYYKFLKTPPHDGKRTEHFREYDGFRNKAMELYCELLEVNGGGGGHQSLDWTAKETVICSVQLAMLESLSENFDGTIAYISSASDALAKLSEGRGCIVELSPIKSASTPSVSGMERRAVDFFTCILIWVHILHCWSCQSLPTAASLYRRILSSTTLDETFLQVAGFDCWVLVLLMDAVEVSIWKGDQDAQNRLSVRELVMKTEAILSKVEHYIQGVANAQTLIYAHGVAIYTHTITSGCRPGVPEIHDALEKCVPLWDKVSFGGGELRCMSWAFCVSASLATGQDRSVFAHVLSEAAAADRNSTTVACLKTISEECWRIGDAGGVECNWRTVMQSLKQSIHTIFT